MEDHRFNYTTKLEKRETLITPFKQKLSYIFIYIFLKDQRNQKRWKRNIFLYFGMLCIFFDEKSSFGSLMSVIDPEGDI